MYTIAMFAPVSSFCVPFKVIILFWKFFDKIFLFFEKSGESDRKRAEGSRHPSGDNRRHGRHKWHLNNKWRQDSQWKDVNKQRWQRQWKYDHRVVRGVGKYRKKPVAIFCSLYETNDAGWAGSKWRENVQFAPLRTVTYRLCFSLPQQFWQFYIFALKWSVLSQCKTFC